MKEIYIICALKADGTETIMREVYSTKEYALEAVAKYSKEDKSRLYYYVVCNLAK